MGKFLIFLIKNNCNCSKQKLMYSEVYNAYRCNIYDNYYIND